MIETNTGIHLDMGMYEKKAVNKRVVQGPVGREKPSPAESGFQYGLDEVRLGADKGERK